MQFLLKSGNLNDLMQQDASKSRPKDAKGKEGLDKNQ
jgi:hypothetical protein